MSDLRKIKIGQAVFVVNQPPRYGTNDRVKSVETVTRIGSRYGYFNRYSREVPFCLKTGQSHHPTDCNARLNGMGFDVYLSEEDWKIAEKVKELRHEALRFMRDNCHQITSKLSENELCTMIAIFKDALKR